MQHITKGKQTFSDSGIRAEREMEIKSEGYTSEQ
jgi:hypothetical protein